MATADGVLDAGLSSMMGDGGTAIVVAGLSASLASPETFTDWNLLDQTAPSEGPFTFVPVHAMHTTERGGAHARTALDDWFERVHSLPRRVDAGDILQEKDYALDFFNAYRYTKRILSSYVNNAGAGIVITDLPTLPVTIDVFGGQLLHLAILVEGPAVIDGDIDFVFDDRSIIIPITGTRAILLAAEPILPATERLSFLTSILLRRDGTEQRAALRMHPRQIFDLVYLTDTLERQFLEARVFGGQERVYGLPIWMEASVLTAAALTGADTVTVDDTRYRDFRVGESVLLYESLTSYQSLQLASKTDTTLTFESSLTADFAANARAMPVRSVRLGQMTPSRKYQKALQETRLQATVMNAGVDLASTAEFSTYNARVLVDDPNRIEETISENMERHGTIIDAETGLLTIAQVWPVSRRNTTKTFLGTTHKRIWEIRQLLHALKGRAIAFYLPTFFDEFTVQEPVASASSVLRFDLFGFTKFVDGKKPRGHVRIVKTDGTSSARAITAANEIDDDTEEITVASSWGIDADVDEIARVEYLELTRFDADDIEFEHVSGMGIARVSVPVKSVLE